MIRYIIKKFQTSLVFFFILCSGIIPSYAQILEVKCHETPPFTPENELEWLEALAEEINKRGFGFYIYKEEIAASNMDPELRDLIAEILRSKN